MRSNEIRKRFLDYFQKNKHFCASSSSVIPADDPTLLFINAGMNQFKDVFLGSSQRDYTRACSSQKCIRMGGKHNDLENVGHTARHLTFFEMLGNFSFGDYFKKEAIQFAWEVSTEIFAFDPEKIWITVFREDDEAYEMWMDIVPEKRILRFDEEDNFWAMGNTGPCGPCSELYYDRGPKYGNANDPSQDQQGDRFLEFWNLVFMQFNRDESGTFTNLPKQSIDTGAGLERVLSLMNNVDSVFETDILRHLIGQVEKVCKIKYEGISHPMAPAYHVIADHIRSLAFSIADGAQPSNLDRGYVLRKALRRAHRYGKTLGLDQPFMAKIFPALLESMGEDFPELKLAASRIEEILTLEEEAFIRTLTKGGNLLQNIIAKSQSQKTKEIAGDDAFKMKDTYGFPLEEIELFAKDHGLKVDLPRYHELETQAKELSKKAHKKHDQQAQESIYKELAEKGIKTEFTGYSHQQIKSQVLAIIKGDIEVSELNCSEEGYILLEKTPFYAEMGGQVGDQGLLKSAETTLKVLDTQSPYSKLIAHQVEVTKGVIKVGDCVQTQVDMSRRLLIEKNHTATHLLHWALCKVVGEHVKQAGSYVSEKRLRFDFNHHKPLSIEELEEIEELINERIRHNNPVDCYELSYQEAQANQEIKQFFGDKYGSVVRVVDIDCSKELCGGTHTSRLGNIGFLKIAKESSIAAGIRRIEAVTGLEAEKLVQSKENVIAQISAVVKSPADKILDRIKKNQEEQQKLQAELKSLQKQQNAAVLNRLLENKQSNADFSFIIEALEVTPKALKELTNDASNKLGSGLLVLANKHDNRCQLVVTISKDLVKKGFNANDIINELAPLVEGGGGGRAENAQAGGNKPEGIPAALEKAKDLIKSKC